MAPQSATLKQNGIIQKHIHLARGEKKENQEYIQNKK